MEYHDSNGTAEHGMCEEDMGRIRGVIEGLLAEPGLALRSLRTADFDPDQGELQA